MMPVPVLPSSGKVAPVAILFVLGVLAVAILSDRSTKPAQTKQQ